VLTKIDIQNFRCIRAAQLALDPQATGIVGENGSGKTSLLESIYFLAHGRSFRTNQRQACSTVVWSRPPKASPISGKL
jgi:DNA replication and repair protein RecF